MSAVFSRPAVGQAAATVVAFPYSGGGTGAYRGLLPYLGTNVNVHLWRPPGRESRLDDRPHASFADYLAEARAVTESLIKGSTPVVLFGCSLGALTAYEVARTVQPARLVVASMTAPQEFDPGSSDDRVTDGALLDLYDPALREEPDLAELVLPLLRADSAVITSYRWQPGPPLSAALTAIVPAADPDVSMSAARGWAEHTTGPFRVVEVPGGHLDLLADVPDQIADLLVPPP